MRDRPIVVFHVVAGLLAHVPAEIERITRFADVHLVFEVSPGAWASNMLDLPTVDWTYGIHDARGHLETHLPERVWRAFEACVGIWYAVYPRLTSTRTATAARAVARKVREIDPDLVHLNGESPRCALWMRMVSVPYVVAVHEPRVPTGAFIPELALAQRMLVPRANRIIAHSEACRAALYGRWGLRPESVILAPLGAVDVLQAYCEAGTTACSSADDGMQVALWGWIGPRKGIDVYLDAAEIASDVLRDVTFVAAGRCCDGYRYPKLPELAHGCRFRVIEGRLSNQELCELVRASDLVALPYTDAMQSEIALTAFAFGKPVVGSDVGGLAEQVERGVTGELFAAGSADAMARALVAVLGDSARLSAMSAAVASRWKTPSSWEAFEHGVRTAYAEVVGLSE